MSTIRRAIIARVVLLYRLVLHSLTRFSAIVYTMMTVSCFLLSSLFPVKSVRNVIFRQLVWYAHVRDGKKKKRELHSRT